jgi:hypothetical protein
MKLQIGVGLVVLVSLQAYDTKQSKLPIHNPDYTTCVNATINVLDNCAKNTKITTGLAAIIGQLKEEGSEKLFAEKPIIQTAESLHSTIFKSEKNPSKLEVMQSLHHYLTEQGMKSFTHNVNKKLESSGLEAIQDNMEMIELNKDIDSQKYFAPFSAALLVMSYKSYVDNFCNK